MLICDADISIYIYKYTLHISIIIYKYVYICIYIYMHSVELRNELSMAMSTVAISISSWFPLLCSRNPDACPCMADGAIITGKRRLMPKKVQRMLTALSMWANSTIIATWSAGNGSIIGLLYRWLHFLAHHDASSHIGKIALLSV